MGIIQRFKDLSTKTKAIILGSSGAVIIIAVVLGIVLGTGLTATTMRLIRAEGSVSIEDGNGNTKPVLDSIRFQSGDAINTGADGLASISLDDKKIVTLDKNSRAEFNKKRNQIELNLTKGGLYFEVTESLKDDETFDIRTSTMIVGIRGTSGYVFYDENGREGLVVTDGVVHVTATNPVTREVREIDVYGGQRIKVFLYNDRATGSIEFFKDTISEDQIPAFPLKMLRENPELLARVCNFTGWDAKTILDIANGTLPVEETEPSESSEESTESSEVSGTPTPTPAGTPQNINTPTPTPHIFIRPNVPYVPGGGTGGGDDDDDDDDEEGNVPASATPTPAPMGSPTPTPEPGATDPTGETEPSSTDPTAGPTPEPTPEPTSGPTGEPTPEPTSEPTPEPTSEPTPEPTSEPTAGPTSEPEPDPTSEPEPEPDPSPYPDDPTVGDSDDDTGTRGSDDG